MEYSPGIIYAANPAERSGNRICAVTALNRNRLAGEDSDGIVVPCINEYRLHRSDRSGDYAHNWRYTRDRTSVTRILDVRSVETQPIGWQVLIAGAGPATAFSDCGD